MIYKTTKQTHTLADAQKDFEARQRDQHSFSSMTTAAAAASADTAQQQRSSSSSAGAGAASSEEASGEHDAAAGAAAAGAAAAISAQADEKTKRHEFFEKERKEQHKRLSTQVQKYLLYWYKSTCFTGTTVQILPEVGELLLCGGTEKVRASAHRQASRKRDSDRHRV